MRRLLVLLITTLFLGMAGAPAGAALVSNEHFTDTSTERVRHFCGDLTVKIRHDIRIHEMVTTRGASDLLYFAFNVQGTVSTTNLANGKTFTQQFRFLSKDLKITDNGDGTLTIINTNPGVAKYYGPNGERLFLDAGTLWLKITVDHAGTPADPDDDEVLDVQIIKAVGRYDTASRDFCEDIHQFIG